jgi:hypothetical protein
MNQEIYETFVHWITERERARVGKTEGLPKPWTDDPIIQQHRFCNVRRDDDRVTRWIQENVIRPNAWDNNLWFNIVLARFFNNEETISVYNYIDDWDEDAFVEKMTAHQKSGGRMFSAAYMIHARTQGIPKHEYLARDVFTPMWNARPDLPDAYATCLDWDTWLAQFYGMGKFMRNQIIVDMKYSPILEKAADWNDYNQPGPGTTRGLNRLHGRDIHKAIPTDQAIDELKGLQAELQKDKRIPEGLVGDISDISNCCCEVDKYLRAVNGEGRIKQKYNGVF